ncbi:hypothetical protein D9M68_489030 [compost metagenome]
MRADVAQHQRVAVGRLARDVIRRDGALRARLVDHDDGLAKQFAHLLPDHAGQCVIAAASSSGHDHGDSALGELRMGGLAAQGEAQRGGAENATGGKCHV